MQILHLHYFNYYYFGSVLSSLLILMDRLFDFMSGSNTAAALGGRSAQPLSSGRFEFMYG